MKINYKDLKLGKKYFVNDIEAETIREYRLCKNLDVTTYKFSRRIKDEDGRNVADCLYPELVDGELFLGIVKIEVYSTKEEAEENRVRILIEGCQALIESCKRDIIKFEKKILELHK